MSDLLAGVLKSTFGLLFDKLRDRTARRFKDGEFFDEQFRQIIVRELDDICTQLQGLSRKDLLASTSFFKEGVNRLSSSLKTSNESFCDEACTSKCGGATAATTCLHDSNALESAAEFSKAIGNLKITSRERYKSAKESFKDSRKLATVAFSNEALSTEDRLLASRIRIASRILECLDDGEAAVRDCLLYLEELQNLPAIQDVFSLWQNREKGITDQLRVRFNKKKRIAAIESIRMINTLLLEVAMDYTNITMGIYDWPTIKTGKTIYHPITDDRKVLMEFSRICDQAPWVWRIRKPISWICALTSRGEILSLINKRDVEVTRRGNVCERLYTMPPEDDRTTRNTIRALDVDENDNVYIVIEVVSFETNVQYKLLTLNANGNVKAGRFLEIVDVSLECVKISVIRDGIVIIYSEIGISVYICHSTNAEGDYKLDLPIPDPASVPFSLTVSSKSDIITVLGNGDDKAKMYIISLHDGKLKREVEIPIKVEAGSKIEQLLVVCDHYHEIILLYCLSYTCYINACDDRLFQRGQSHEPCTAKSSEQVYNFLDTGELVHKYEIPYYYDARHPTSLRAHPKGVVTLITAERAIVLGCKNK